MDTHPNIHRDYPQSPKGSAADQALEEAYRRQYNDPNRQKTGQLQETITPSKALKRKRGYANNLHHHGRDFQDQPQSSRTFWAVVSDSMDAQFQHKTPEKTGENNIIDLESDDDDYYDEDFYDEDCYDDGLDDGVPLPTEPHLEEQFNTQLAFQREMSIETVLDHDRVPYGDTTAPRSTSFDFVRLDKKIQNKILQLLLVRRAAYTPWYNYCSTEQPEEYVQAPDIDIPFVLANKEISARATEIFYGENVFDFRRPEASLWWLKRIGSNASKIRTIRVYFTTGRDFRFRTSQEMLWLKLFAWFKRTQRISEALINFNRWYNLPKKGEDEWPEQTTRERDEIVRLLESYKGLEHAEIVRGPWLTGLQAKDLGTSMAQGRLVKDA